jgi:hypothetical protein
MPKTNRSDRRKRAAEPEIPVEALLRLEHAGRWIAWAEDHQSVVAVGDDHVAVREAARQAGVPHAPLEWAPLLSLRSAGSVL